MKHGKPLSTRNTVTKKIKATLEIKYRGPLTARNVNLLLQFLKTEAILRKAEHDQVLYLESTAFPSIGDFNWGVARMSIKIAHTTIRLRLKEGNAANHKRDEYEIRLPKSQGSNLLYMLHRLGLTEAFYRPSFRQEFKYGNLIIIIKQQCVMGDHFEVQLQNDLKASHIELHHFLKKFGLVCWTELQYKTRITKLMKTSPALPILDAPFFKSIC